MFRSLSIIIPDIFLTWAFNVVGYSFKFGGMVGHNECIYAWIYYWLIKNLAVPALRQYQLSV